MLRSGAVITPHIASNSWQSQRSEPGRVESLLLLCRGSLVRLSHLDGSEWRSVGTATAKTRGSGVDVAVMRGSRTAAFKLGKRCSLFQNSKQGFATDVPRAKSGPRTEVLWPTEGSNSQASITVFERYYQGPWRQSSSPNGSAGTEYFWIASFCSGENCSKHVPVQCFSNLFIPSPSFHSLHVVFAPKPDKANTIEWI